jgi:membrane protein
VTDSRIGIPQILKRAFDDFGEDECGIRAAALAYFTVFALPPLLILLVMITGWIWGPEQVQRAIESQFAGMMGQSGAQQVHQMLVHGNQSAGGGTVATIMSTVGLILGATGAFLSLQDALNRVWEVKPDPKQGGIKSFITKRLLSMGMVLGLGFLLAVSLALTAGISAIGGALGGGLSPALLHVLDLVVSFAVLTALFAALFKVLPDAEIAWRDVWMGGAATAALFVLGKFAIGLYLGHSNPGDAFGAAGALAVILVWAYYAGMILLFGAEFTQEWATARGSGIVPSAGAVKVVKHEEEIRGGTSATAGRAPESGARGADARAGGAKAGPSDRGGFVHWLVGLPVLLLLFRGKGSRSGGGGGGGGGGRGTK